MLCTTALRDGNYAAARQWLDEAIELDEAIADGGRLGNRETNIAVPLMLMGELSYWEGNYTKSRLYYERQFSIIQTRGLPWGTAWVLVRLGYAVLRQGDLPAARKIFLESYQQFQNNFVTQRRIGAVYALEGLASLATLQNAPLQAAKLFAFTDAAREEIGDTRPPNEQAEIDRDLATLHTQLDEATFAAAQKAGHILSVDEAITLAMEATHE